MSATIGFTALLLIISLNLFLPFFNFLAYKKDFLAKKIELNHINLIITATTFLLTLSALFCLIYSYIISDYSILNVYKNSHHLKPLLYKITGAWGNHEGSMLLLILILSSYSLAFALMNKSEFKITTLSVQSLIITGITSFTAFTSNPFELIFPAPIEGLELNPLLQDIGLALHPPVLYIGYVGSCIIFSLAIAGLLQEKVNAKLAQNMLFWLFFSWAFLTIGIGLGAWWAYRELGWGGYWFWDPVENVSLLPWLASIALIHAIKILHKKESYKLWTILLSIVNFILSLFGIFLVRSGLLTSVHSFAVDAKRGFFIIFLITIIGGLALLIFALKAPKIKTENRLENNGFLSKINMILLNNYFLVIALFTMLLGILYPIFSLNFFNHTISIGATYYNKIFSILLLPFLLCLVLFHFKEYKEIIKWQNLFIYLVCAVISLIIFINYNNLNFIEIALIFLSFVSAFLAIKGKKNVTNIAHFGFAVMLLGILLSSLLGLTKEINIKENEIITINESYKARFDKVEHYAGKNFIARKAVFTVFRYKENNSGQIVDKTLCKNTRSAMCSIQQIAILQPELRYYPISNQTTFEASIAHLITGDLYFAVGNKDENENYALRIYLKPFIYLIWIGLGLIFLASMLKLRKILINF